MLKGTLIAEAMLLLIEGLVVVSMVRKQVSVGQGCGEDGESAVSQHGESPSGGDYQSSVEDCPCI